MSDTAILTLRTMLANLDDAKKYQSLRDVMSTLPAPDLAAVFEDLPPEKLPVLFRLCPKDLAAEIFAELTPETQQDLIDGLTDKELKAVVDDLFVDDATDLVEEMPANVVKRILAQADPATRRMINELLKYPEDSAGGVMTCAGPVQGPRQRADPRHDGRQCRQRQHDHRPGGCLPDVREVRLPGHSRCGQREAPGRYRHD